MTKRSLVERAGEVTEAVNWKAAEGQVAIVKQHLGRLRNGMRANNAKEAVMAIVSFIGVLAKTASYLTGDDSIYKDAEKLQAKIRKAAASIKASVPPGI